MTPLERTMTEEQQRSASPQVMNHFEALDGMRGILAVIVMLFHLGLNTLISSATDGALQHGEWRLAVDFFFLLSGFVLCRSFLLRPPTIGAFAAKRFARLAPMMVICTTLAWLLDRQTHHSLGVIAANYAMVHSIFELPSINGPSWSVPFELFLPVAGLLWIQKLRSLPRVLLLSILALAMLSSGWATYLLASGDDLMMFRASAGLSTGALLYLTYDKFQTRTRPPTRGLHAYLFFALAVTTMALTSLNTLVSLAFVPLSVLAIWTGTHTRGLLTSAPLQALGRWSYSVYLLHIPVILSFQVAAGAPAIDGNVLMKFAAIVVTIGLSAICYQLVEVPFIRLGSRLLRAPHSLPVANSGG